MNMDGEYYIEIVADYIRNMPPIPTFKEAPQHKVEQESYKHWAAGMVLERFEKAYAYRCEMYDDPAEIIQDFIDEMDYWYCYTPKRNKASLMFYLAKVEGEQIGLLFV